MRTTLTLDEDVAQQLRSVMRERGGSFKSTVNDLLRLGLRADRSVEPYDPPRYSSGVHAGVDLDKALALVGTLEDDEVLRKMSTGK